MKRAHFLATLTILALIAGCAGDSPVDTASPQDTRTESELRSPEARAIAADLEQLAVYDPARWNSRELPKGLHVPLRRAVRVPAGSVDALAGAIAEAGPRGVVLVESGEHVESETVTIEFPVTILGEEGAAILVDTQPYPDVVESDGAFYVNDANQGPGRVVIAGLEIRPQSADSAGTGIIVRDTSRVAVLYNSIAGHQLGVLLQQADQARIQGNRIELNPAISEHGVAVINGDHVGVSGNVITGAVFGIWACDEFGYAAYNDLSGSFLGLILCKVPPAGYVMPDGTEVGSENPATKWHVAFNNSYDNVVGYMVIDGATSNVVALNRAENNAAYDYQIVPSTEVLFGFCTPTAVDTFLLIANSTDVVKDCGVNSVIIGGSLVDLSADPCEPPCSGEESAADAVSLRSRLRHGSDFSTP